MKPLLVLIAQAHGKDTYGKCSPNRQLLEYRWSREVSVMLKNDLERLNFDAIIINPEENEVPLYVQAKRVNEIYDREKKNYREIILVSMHVNASAGSGWSDASGWTVYVYNKAGKDSITLAKCLADVAYNKYELQGNRYIPEDKIFRANFAILRQTKTPAILSENMFMTNRDDMKYLLSEQGKKNIVNLHVVGIIQYFQKKMVQSK